MAAVKKAIGVYNLGSSIDFDSDINFLTPARSSEARAVSFNLPDKASWTSERTPGALSGRHSVQDWVKMFEGLDMTEEERPQTASIDFSKDGTESFEAQSFTVASRANQMATERIGQPATEASYFQLFNRYIISQTQEDTILIDQRAAWERILYEQYKKMLSKRSGGSQQLLFPKTIRLSPADMQLVEETQSSIKDLGFEFDNIGSNTLIIRGVPSEIPTDNEQEMFEELLDQIRQNYSEIRLSRPDGLIRSLAKRFAPKYNLKMSSQEIREMLNRLFDTSDPNRTPGGEPITVRLSIEKLTSIFHPVGKNK
jgi:DNA mismatch repair protein MutL